MIINDLMIWDNKEYKLIWHDCDNFEELEGKDLQQSYGVCFCDNKLVIVSNNGKWSLVGGHIEKGETPEEALSREVQEETNMKVLNRYLLDIKKL